MYQVEIQSQLNFDTQRSPENKERRRKKKVNNADLLLPPTPFFYDISSKLFLSFFKVHRLGME